MEERTETINGPMTPLNEVAKVDVKKSSDVPPKSSSESKAEPVSGLFASPIFVSKVAGSTPTEPASVTDAPATLSGNNAEDAATLAQIQFATPSPFLVRTKRARSTASLGSGAQKQQKDHISNSEARRPEGFSPIACFPSLERALKSNDTAAPKAQRDLFANGACSRAVQSPNATATPAAAGHTRKPRIVTTFGELVAQGLRQQRQQQALPDAISSDDEEGPEEDGNMLLKAPTKLMLSAKDEQWLGKIIAHYTSQTS